MTARKSATDRKAEIVEALLVLSDRIGPDRLTTNDIAREVGITQAAIFRHFPSKAALWTAAGEVIVARLGEAWGAALEPQTSPRERLRAVVAAQLAQIEAWPALPVILFSRELNVENPALRGCFNGALQRFQAHLVEELTKILPSGALSPADAAVFLSSLVQGIAIRWSLGARGFDLTHEGLRLFDVQLALIAPE